MDARQHKSDARLDVRLDPETKGMIERAANITGQSVTAFAVSTLAAEARQIVQRHERVVLTDRDRNRFLELLDRDDEPNEALKKAAKTYKRGAH